MTQPPIIPPPPPQQPGPPAYSPPGPPPAKKKRSPLMWILLAGAAVFVLIVAAVGVTVAVMSGQDTGSRSSQLSQPEPLLDEGEIGVQETTAAPAPGPSPAVADFKLTPKVTDKQCFGSAGCSLELQVEVEYNGPVLDQDDTWLVTYEVSGDESGPIIGSLELSGTTFEASTESLSTKNSKTKVAIKVTDVDKVGI